MPLSAQVIFDTPQQEVASELRRLFRRCRSVSIVTGFATVAGVETLLADLHAHPDRLQTLVVGAATLQAFDAIDTLLTAGVAADRLFVHLGHVRPKGGDPGKIWGYHPMMHSKVYLFEMDDGTSAALVGSHNLTKFALQGLNAEAATLLTGPTKDPEMRKVCEHVRQCRDQAVPYDPALKAGFAQWASDYFRGLWVESYSAPTDVDRHQTVVMLLARPAGRLPKGGETIYFELPLALQQRIKNTNTEAHVILLPTPPASAQAALRAVGSAVAALRCRVVGLDDSARVREVETDWHIPDRRAPVVTPAPRPFRPASSSGMQQVWAEVEETLRHEYEYLFESDRVAWIPVYDTTRPLRPQGGNADSPPTLEQRPRRRSREDDPEWYPVTALRRFEPEEPEELQKALLDASPASESFVLFSVRRRRLDPGETGLFRRE
jgi:hypothetical protein